MISVFPPNGRMYSDLLEDLGVSIFYGANQMVLELETYLLLHFGLARPQKNFWCLLTNDRIVPIAFDNPSRLSLTETGYAAYSVLPSHPDLSPMGVAHRNPV